MNKNDIIIELVRAGFDYTYDYENDVYGDDTRRIIFTKTGFRSTPIFMKDLNQSHIEQVKKEYEV